METRDLLALLISLLAIYLTLQNEGNVSFRKSWYVKQEIQTYFVCVFKRRARTIRNKWRVRTCVRTHKPRPLPLHILSSPLDMYRYFPLDGSEASSSSSSSSSSSFYNREPLEGDAIHFDLPRPIVADLNGDGHPEVILVTSNNTLQVPLKEEPKANKTRAKKEEQNSEKSIKKCLD